jgi:hypothetical protein
VSGAIAIVIALLIVIPVGTLVTGAVIAGVLGHFLKDNGEKEHEGSELIALNR